MIENDKNDNIKFNKSKTPVACRLEFFTTGKHMRNNQQGQEEQYSDIILAPIFHYMFIILAGNNIKQASENLTSVF